MKNEAKPVKKGKKLEGTKLAPITPLAKASLTKRPISNVVPLTRMPTLKKISPF